MANGRRALSSSASRGTWGKSLLCHSGVMWITELATNTITAENRIGSHSDSRLTMETPLFFWFGRDVARAGHGGAGRNFNQTRPLAPAPPLGSAPWAPV